MVVKIDVDGVLRDIITRMCIIYNDAFGETIFPWEVDEYDINKVFTEITYATGGMSAVDFFFREKAEDVFVNSDAFPDAAESLDRLRSAGHKVVIVTWQFTTDNKEYTLKFLDKCGLHYDDICFTRDKWMVYGDYLIDDNPEFVLDGRDKSVKILVSRPYNNGVKGVKKVSTLSEAVDAILCEEILDGTSC
ncbi:MAG: hypothetical protein J6Y37_12020 [Paludibacteraceae bacterium]|nr:hypothetical protein [Paludibacteraceae bacterium]